jgi:hypothetical protein
MSVNPVVSAIVSNSAPHQPEASPAAKVDRYVKGDRSPKLFEPKAPSRDGFSFEPLGPIKQMEAAGRLKRIKKVFRPPLFNKDHPDHLRRFAMSNSSK